MGELRRVLGVLRQEQEEEQERLLGPQPGILDPFLSQVRAAGLTVTYRTEGALASLDNGVQLTVYRIAQEASTNTLKHAGPGSSAEVTVAADAGRRRIRATDSRTPPATPVREQWGPKTGFDPGHALVGIRQRAATYGGDVTLGPRDARPGWIVDVVLDVPSALALSASGELLP